MMRDFTTTAALLAVLCGSAATPVWAQSDLEQMVEEALERQAPLEGVDAGPDDLGFEDALEPEPFTAAELDDLVAPVALYPDALLAQVLVAATFPLQIVYADRILARSDELSDDEMTAALEERDWDPSVLVLLSAFPDLIQRMAEDLEDTEQLGLAMAQQDADVLEAVQRMRARAEATGYLQSNAAQVVEREDDRIYIAPADPEVIYLPSYDPVEAYASRSFAQPVIQQPGFGQTGLGGLTFDNPLVAGAIGFGSAVLLNELFLEDDDNNNNNDKDGWNNYWRRDRPIDWRECQVYPRAYGGWDDADRRREVAWSEERDRFWDRQERRWRREAQDARRAAWRDRRDGRGWQVRRDPETGAARVRLDDWRDAEALLDRRDAAQARRDRQAAEERTAERRQAERERDRLRERADERRQDAREERREDTAERRAREAAEERRDAVNERRLEADEAQRARARRATEREAAEDRRRAADRPEETASQAAEERRRRQDAERAAARDRREREARREDEARPSGAQANEREAEQRRQAAEERRRREAAERDRAEREAGRAREQAAEQREAAERRRNAAAAEERRTQEAAREARRQAERQAEQREAAQRARREQAEEAAAQEERQRAAVAEERRRAARAQEEAAERSREQERARAQQQPARQQASERAGGQQRQQSERREQRRRDCPEGAAGRDCRRGGG